MIETFELLPVSFWIVVALLGLGCMWAGEKIRSGIGIPMIAVLGTVAAWYVVDLFYNGYRYYTTTFRLDVLESVWWQVALFLTSFTVITPFVHETLNANYRLKKSSVYRIYWTSTSDPFLQRQLHSLLRVCLWIWCILALIAALRLGTDIPYYFFPFLRDKADPWARGRLGVDFDSLLSLAGYLQSFIAASFGIAAALMSKSRSRYLAFCGCATTWPYFIFDRTRNAMLAAVLPGVIAWIILRVHGWWVKKALILTACFVIVNAWFGFVIANRSGDLSIAEAFQQNKFDFDHDSNVHHEGLNMLEELCWINVLTSNGVYQPNWGESYLDELISPIPRALWPGKPAAGFDYSIARGLSDEKEAGGVAATLSTGMIGQGVAAFGPIIGPVFAALLMAVWASILARLDLRGKDVELYGMGLILTFNLGRDIKMMTLYSFVFGAIALWCLKRFSGGSVRTKLPKDVLHKAVNALGTDNASAEAAVKLRMKS